MSPSFSRLCLRQSTKFRPHSSSRSHSRLSLANNAALLGCFAFYLTKDQNSHNTLFEADNVFSHLCLCMSSFLTNLETDNRPFVHEKETSTDTNINTTKLSVSHNQKRQTIQTTPTCFEDTREQPVQRAHSMSGIDRIAEKKQPAHYLSANTSQPISGV